MKLQHHATGWIETPSTQAQRAASTPMATAIVIATRNPNRGPMSMPDTPIAMTAATRMLNDHHNRLCRRCPSTMSVGRAASTASAIVPAAGPAPTRSWRYHPSHSMSVLHVIEISSNAETNRSSAVIGSSTSDQTDSPATSAIQKSGPSSSDS